MIENYDATKLEPEILEFWKKHEIYEKAKKKSKGMQKFYFLDGPPYTSGKVHLGTAWNKSLKDSILRYKRMKGFDVWDRAGYDMHGLQTEQAVDKNLGLKNKDEIPNYVGGNSFLELGFGFILGKKLFLLHKVPEMPFIKQEILGMQPTVLDGVLSNIQ